MPEADSEIRAELCAVARELLGKSRNPSWLAMTAARWTGLEISESLDGAGVSFAETAVIYEELGRAAARSSFLGAAVLGAGTLLAVTQPRPGTSCCAPSRQATRSQSRSYLRSSGVVCPNRRYHDSFALQPQAA